MTSYEDDWKSKRIWKVKNQIRSVLPAETILIFTGDVSGTSIDLKSSGPPSSASPWGSGCTHNSPRDEVSVNHGGTTYTIQRDASSSPAKLTCTLGSSSFFTAEEEMDPSMSTYNRQWKPTRLWKVKTSCLPDVPVGYILSFKGSGNGLSGSDLAVIGPLNSLGNCTYRGGMISLVHASVPYTIILRPGTLTLPATLDCDPDGGGTGAAWTAEEGG